MSMANQIIIPIISSKQNLEDQNIFIPTYFTLTPSKHDELPDFAFWRKSSSAFKKFKEKKDRKEKRNQPDNENTEPMISLNHRKCFKLLKKQKSITRALLQNENKRDMPFGYYDPNEAPLYETHLTHEYEYRSKTQDPHSKSQKMDEQIQVVKQERMESEMADEDIQVKFMVETRPDDPFIIIRKESIKKSNPLPYADAKTVKTKNIKKEKNTKGKESDDFEKNKNFQSKAKDHSEPRGRGQDPALPALISRKTSHSKMGDQHSSDSLESPDPAGHPSSKKEIFTIQQLMDLAKPKPSSQLGRYLKEEGSPLGSEYRQEQRCKFIQ